MKIKFLSFNLLKKLCNNISKKSLRIKLIFVFILSFICSIIIAVLFNGVLNSIRIGSAHVEYSNGIKKIDDTAKKAANELNNNANVDMTSVNLKNILDELYDTNHLNAIITDLQGNILINSKDSTSTKINLYDIIKDSTNKLLNEDDAYDLTDSSFPKKVYYSFYPISLKDKKGFLIVSGIPQSALIYSHSDNGVISIILGIVIFIILFLLLTRNKMQYIEDISQGLIEISKGDLNYRVPSKGNDELSTLSANINNMAYELNSKIEKERSAEKAKNELITNVSHDLRTPLTSIMGYLGLLKNKKYESEDQMEEYLDIAYNKSEKLKILIEDLFEYTKLTNEKINLEKEPVALNEFLEQLVEEMVPIFEENNLTLLTDIPKEKLIVDVDINKILRVFENLLMNAVKYSVKPSEINVKLYRENTFAVVCTENIGEHIQENDLKKIFDRFYRLEKSRSTSTGGSGLGLAIAKSIVELHGGEIEAKCEGKKISFFVKLKTF